MTHGNTKHGHNTRKKSSPTHNSWCSMKRRCKSKSGYFDRGIDMCDRWQVFENFLFDMGERPIGMTLGRIDNNKGYFLDNCRWENNHQQNTNRRSTILIEYNNEMKCVRDWHKQTGLSERCILYRYHNGWSAEKILTTPMRKK
jgi:hypothetical protein